MAKSKPYRSPEGNELKIPNDRNKGQAPNTKKYRSKKKPRNKSSLDPETETDFCTSWYWGLVPCSCHLGSSIHYLQVSGMDSIWPLPHLFLIFLVLMMNSRFVFDVICTG